ncbi:porin family protein [Sphingomonas paeninsulae]|jgi:outer membrane immunogenic protein|uniref:Porin family protein n=1 Tax=Sphingomonas paeninsulae TaxID=2319844 RepID=A0A494TES9_SPHPE|nr:outer membrane beta-barrel protein [Sphingomonas paeninsulae]AYJ85814.1 porin family protein [Sphingomonas paeninsulae]
MRKLIVMVGTALSLISGVASAQETSFRGLRVEGNIGGDRYQSEGIHNDRLGYGGTIGFDGMIGDRIVIGPEASFWRANKWTENCSGVPGGSLCDKSFDEWGAAVRAGVLVNPNLLVFGKGGYVNNEQRQRFDSATISVPSSYDHFRTDGYQVGGGVEYTLTGGRLPVYVNAQYVFSKYDDNTSRQRVMMGLGFRFK